MGTMLDFTVGMSAESVYGTYVAPTRFAEAEAKLKYDVQTVQSPALRPSKRVALASRNSVAKYDVSGDLEMDVLTKGAGFYLKGMFGAVTSTQDASTTVYQHVFTPSQSAAPPSYTIQEVLPLLDGTLQPHTFTGCSFSSFELTAAADAMLRMKFGLVGKQLVTATGAVAATYLSPDPDVFTFLHGNIKLGGTLTAPTTTALATSSAAAAVNVKDVTITVNNGLDSEGWNLGGAGMRSRSPVNGAMKVTGKMTVEYTDNVLRDAYLAQTSLPLLLTFTHPTPIVAALLGSFQVALPAIRLKGEVPASNGGAPITQSIDFEAFDSGSAAQPIWVVYRSLDVTA